ncbi:Kef-type K+ transport system, membrane component KefB [Sinomicrobium oceani]|uniref:Kef-type K+ transport system, membrane component KefB n=1 Tax=Sinomicrobium oceani TaxID=1150368 RepID=A0A1K1N1K8_9FLAO|nr:cation:proton antiporter [Sinomicrobium oceani]SFW29215.1 Kef-type K+ transport system, membrane component KefB [Sinomicrobium oceani]
MDTFFEHLAHEFELPLANPVLVFTLILLIILVSPILLRRLNIPGIIVLILSGVLIGPHGLNLLAKNSAVDLFSTIGLLYIMFIAGLELDMNEFRANRNKSLMFGFFTFIIPLGIGLPVCYYLLDYGFNASFLTASMFATHTLVTYPIVSKLGVSKNQAVAITVGGTILTDTAVLIILAVIMGSESGGLTTDFWIRLAVSLTIFLFIIFFLIPKIAKWFFGKLQNEKHSHYIFVLFIVFAAAFLAEISGVEPIIGAFMAGLALNRLIPHSSALMNRIEFIGNALFIPFFLISVGMLVDIRVILSGPMALVVAGTLSVVALLGKWLASLCTQVLFKYSGTQRQLIFGLSSSHAAATLAVILVGYKAKILDENILNGTIILILITCIIASFATEKAAKKILKNSEEDYGNSTEPVVYDEHILIPIANTQNMEKALEFATLVKDKKSTYPISILRVVPNNQEAEKNIGKAKDKLESFTRDASASETATEVIATIDYNASNGIARTAREIMANLIILGWPRRKGFIQKLIGEKMEHVLTYTDKTLFICDFQYPLVDHGRILVMAPPFAELEKGFILWTAKISALAQELSTPIVYSCNTETRKAIEKYKQENSINAVYGFEEINSPEDFFTHTGKLKRQDLLILISARKGAISHRHGMDNLPARTEKHFHQNSKIIIYP